jgi:hypothetical protein
VDSTAKVKRNQHLGHHSKMVTLKTYANLFENSKREAMDKIEAYRDGIQSKNNDL